MLIITRRVGEAVVIADQITLRVFSKYADRVVFTATAPPGTYCTEFEGESPARSWHARDRVMIRRGADPTRITLPDGRSCAVRIFYSDDHRQGVRIGFEAPRELTVDREEIWKQKRAGIRPGGLRMLAAACLCATLLTGCATGNELRGAWLLTIGRSGTCRVVEHRASTDQLQTRTTWRGEGCPSVTPPTEEPARGVNGEVLK